MIIRTWQFASVPSMVDVIFVFRAERSNHVVAFIDYTPFAISLPFVFILRSDSPCIGRKSLLWNTMMASIIFTGLLFMDMVFPFFHYATITWTTWITHFNFSGPGINLILIAPVPVQLLFSFSPIEFATFVQGWRFAFWFYAGLNLLFDES